MSKKIKRKGPQPRLSVSEARAEAAALLLRRVLVDLPEREAMIIRAHALAEATQTGVVAIVEELLWICDPPPER